MTSAPFESLAATVLAMNVRTSDTVFAAGMPDRKMWSIHSGVYAVLSADGMSGFSPQKVQAGVYPAGTASGKAATSSLYPDSPYGLDSTVPLASLNSVLALKSPSTIARLLDPVFAATKSMMRLFCRRCSFSHGFTAVPTPYCPVYG